MKASASGALAAVLAATALVSGCGKSADPREDLAPWNVTFSLRNDGPTSVFLFESCVLDLKIIALADSHVVGRGAGCACACADQSCTSAVICGACFEGSHEVTPGSTLSYGWTASDVSYENRGSYQCARTPSLPAGSYRIDVPVYGAEADAASQTAPRTVTKTFELPPPADISIALNADF